MRPVRAVLSDDKKQSNDLEAYFLPPAGPHCDQHMYWAIQRSWFARVNALCNLSRKKSREVAAHFRADF